MNQVLRCTGYALAGAGLVSGGVAVVFGVIWLCIYAGKTIAAHFELASNAADLIGMGIIFAAIGAGFGGVACYAQKP